MSSGDGLLQRFCELWRGNLAPGIAISSVLAADEGFQQPQFPILKRLTMLSKPEPLADRVRAHAPTCTCRILEKLGLAVPQGPAFPADRLFFGSLAITALFLRALELYSIFYSCLSFRHLCLSL